MSASRASVAALLVALAGGAGAQTDQVPRPSEHRLEAPAYAPAEPPPIRLPAPPAAPPGAISGLLRLELRGVRFTGNTAIDTATLEAVAAPYVGRVVTNAELQQLRTALTRLYIERGYVNSGVIIPDQTLEQGIVEFRVIEGVLADIAVSGVERLPASYVRDRLALGAGPPLEVSALRDRIQLLLRGPFVRQVDATLAPGERPGEARLHAEVVERSPFGGGLVVDNDLSPSVGSVQASGFATWYSPGGLGDLLALEDVTVAEGLKQGRLSYTVPLGPRDTTLRLHYDRSLTDVVEDPFDRLDIVSRSTTVGVRLAHPLLLTPRRQLVASVAVERRASKTFLLGMPFSFTPGPKDGRSQVTVLRLAQEYVDREPDQVLAARSTLSIGLDALGATRNSAGADGRFLAWLGQLQWVRRLRGQHEVVARADVQLAADRLLPLEKYAVGGAGTVRGYRTNQLVRDWGYSVSVEYRVPILRGELGDIPLRAAAFLDVGVARDRDVPAPGPDTLAAVGLGLLWNPSPSVDGALYWGHALRDVPVAGERDLQDNGFHFALRARFD
ncbi:MAG: ShlB/FhaC/HecB family hemolysin secretion/activation protein [Ectothiorhodospiraceae bacterium]|nr:ShlB/FhaC/HecB family hemolysin secretion/activation protein [Chromatiales bacterium]MCP5156084.1 ShlB/FhaC/HecB family hemolysin secretion/activation protein [Ectothiorhodospiraceae bacterium]